MITRLHTRPQQQQPQHHDDDDATTPPAANPLPTLLHTPSGLALLELQGTINLPPTAPTPTDTASDANSTTNADTTFPIPFPIPIPIGQLHFPDYHGQAHGQESAEEGPWMKRVWLYVGGHQRLQGEVKRLPRAVAVLRRRRRRRRRGGGENGGGGRVRDGDGAYGGEVTEGEAEAVEEEEGEGEGEGELEVVEVVKYKIVFSSRPEPVGNVDG